MDVTVTGVIVTFEAVQVAVTFVDLTVIAGILVFAVIVMVVVRTGIVSFARHTIVAFARTVVTLATLFAPVAEAVEAMRIGKSHVNCCPGQDLATALNRPTHHCLCKHDGQAKN